jgi:uncharacterized membrane protein
MSITSHFGTRGMDVPAIEHVALDRPFLWLGRGWQDLRAAPAASLAYGLLVAALGALILGFGRNPYLLAATTTGFLLVGPLFTTGLCELSRRRAAGESLDFDSSLSALGRNRSALTRLGGELLLIGLVWLGLSTLMLQLALGTVGPGVHETLWGGGLADLTAAALIGYAVVGAVLACVVFARTVVAVPMIIDRGADERTAVATSLRVTLSDLPAMIVWAGLVTALVAFGFASFLIGMILVFPLLGHATWHAYHDLVRSQR